MTASEIGFTGRCQSWYSIGWTNLVGDIVCARILHLHHHIRMQEVGLDHVWYKGRVLLLEHDGHYVVAYVPLPLQLEGTDKHN